MLRARILFFGSLLLTCAAVRAADSPVRLYSEDGWKIPRLAKILAGHPAKEEKLDWGVPQVTARSFEFQSSPGGGYRVLFLSREDETNYITWRSIGPRTITAYSLGKRLFGVLIEGVVELADPKTGQGGTGGEVRLYYEDVDGSGKLKLLLENLPVTFRPEIPEWSRKRGAMKKRHRTAPEAYRFSVECFSGSGSSSAGSMCQLVSSTSNTPSL